MKKLIAISLAVVLVLTLGVGVALAAGKNGPAGNSNVGHLYLCEKDASWSIVPDGAWGKLKYNLSGPTFDFVFNGHGLQPNTPYSLIYYADFDPRFTTWGGNNPGALIATGTTNRGGNIHLAGSEELNMNLPSSSDWNIAPVPDYCDYHNGFDDYDHCSGAKIWLVPSSDYNAGIKKVIAWNPTQYLFETDLIWYDDTDAP